jgi:hypothetical protein
VPPEHLAEHLREFQMTANTPPIRKRLALFTQALIVFFALSGIAVIIWNAPTPAARWNNFSFYTIQSNLLVAAALLSGMRFLLAGRHEPGWVVIFKSGALLWILVTGVVYSLLLGGRWQPQGAMVYANLAVHFLTPLGMLLNWLLFEPKGRYRPVYVLAWLAYPLAYMLGSWVRGALTGFYPYWFLNPSAPYPEGAGSLGAMLGVVGLLTAGFLLVSMVILLSDRLWGRAGRTA